MWIHVFNTDYLYWSIYWEQCHVYSDWDMGEGGYGT